MSPPLGSGSGSGSDLSERQTPSRDFRSMTPGCGVTPPPQTESASLDVSGDGIMHLEPRPFRPFKTSEEYLYAMKEDLAEWLNTLYGLSMTAENFMEVLETGVVLCDHANSVRRCADQFQTEHVERRGRRFSAGFRVPSWDVSYNRQARAGSFFARDNIHNFIRWCNELGVLDCLMFETEDLVSRKNEKHVILCLLEIARRGAKFGMAAPILVQFEQQIDREIAREQAGEDAEDAEDEQELEDEPEEPPMVYGPTQQVVTNDLKSLDEMVRDLVERCSCPSQFPMIRVSEGKYRIGDTKTLIFVRILRNHVMVRVGGGWDTLEHYLDKHDPCRCRSGHRATIASRLFMKPGTHDGERQLSAVKYERHDGDLSSDAGSSPALRTPISFRGSPALRRPSQLSAPDKRLYEEVSGDSSSEVSDEGYRSQGHWKGAHSLKGAENMDRPESSLTHSSTESSDPTTEQPMSPTTPTTPTAPWPSEMGDKPAKTRRSFMGMIKSLRPPKASPPPPTAATPPPAPQRRMSTDSLRRGGLQRSQSGGSEAGLRASVRTNRASEARMARCGKNTWSGGGGRQRERPALGADTFRAPPPNRATSASPGPRRRAPPQPAASPAPRRKHSHLLADLMDDPELDDDAKVLQKMEELVRQYKPFLAQRQREVDGLSPPPGASSSVSPPPPPAPRVTPRKESGAGVGKSRIPAPTFFQQSRSPTETCL